MDATQIHKHLLQSAQKISATPPKQIGVSKTYNSCLMQTGIGGACLQLVTKKTEDEWVSFLVDCFSSTPYEHL